MLAPIQTTEAISVVSQEGGLFAFMLLVLIGLSMVIRTLYKNNVEQGKENMTALLDSTLAINNNTAALQLLTKQIEKI